MLTLNQIVSQITNLAAAHNQIAESGVGDFAEWQAKERTYPILWVFHESTSVNQMEISFSIRLICADRVIVGEEGDNTEGHEQEVISDTLLVLLDFLAYFQQNHSQPYNVVTSATIDPFTERLNDRLAGNSVTIQIRQPFDWNKCQIPQSGASIPPSVDGLTLYNFCDASVLARLTDAQNACLSAAFNEPCQDVDITINSTPFGSEPSGGTFDVVVVNGGDNPVGSEQSGEWVIGNSTVTINGTQVGDIVAEDSLPIAVELDGNPSGTWNASTQTWEVTTPPCAPATFSIDGTQVDTIASGADLDVSVELNGAPVTPTYNSGTKVIGVTGGVSGSIAVAVSNATPTFGQSITITATPTGFTPTNYIFFAYDGSDITWVAEQAGASVNWTVSVVGAFEVYALGTDGALEVYGMTNVTAATSLVCDSIATAPVAGFSVARRLSINYLGDAMLIRRSSDNATLSIGFIGEAVDTAAIAAFVGANNAFTATIFNQFGATNAQQVTAANQPTIVVTGTIQTLGGRPTVVFDGSTDEMTIASSITAVHGFTVARKASNTNLIQSLLGGSIQGLWFGGTLAGFTSILIFSAGGNLISGVDNTLPHQVTFRMGTAGAGRLRVDGALTASGTTSANLVISRIGTREDIAFRHIGSFSEVILYSSALSDADQGIIESNQISYYGI